VEERPPIWGAAGNILNKQSRTVDKGWFSSFGVGEVVLIPHHVSCYESKALNWNDTLVRINPLNAELNPICHLLILLGARPILHIRRLRIKQRRRDMRFGTWNVRSLYIGHSNKTPNICKNQL
jgi:hypothetical protein